MVVLPLLDGMAADAGHADQHTGSRLWQTEGMAFTKLLCTMQGEAAHTLKPAEQKKLCSSQPQHKGHPDDIQKPSRADAAHCVGRQENHAPHQHKGDRRAKNRVAEHTVRQSGTAGKVEQRQGQQRQQAKQRYIQPANPLHRSQDKAFDDSLGEACTGKACCAHPRAGGQHIEQQPKHCRRKGGQLPEVAPPCAEHCRKQQQKKIQKPGHLMAAADDQTAQAACGCVQHPAPQRKLRSKAERKGKARVQHRKREIRQVVHRAVEPVQPLDRGGHSLNKSKGQQQRQRPGQPFLRRR